jgi:hypothetical protein
MNTEQSEVSSSSSSSSTDCNKVTCCCQQWQFKRQETTKCRTVIAARQVAGCVTSTVHVARKVSKKRWLMLDCKETELLHLAWARHVSACPCVRMSECSRVRMSECPRVRMSKFPRARMSV